MLVLPSGFQSLESLALWGLLAMGLVSGNVLLALVALVLIALLHRKSPPREESEFTY